MRLLRTKHLVWTVTAMLSLFVSAVSACACSHHAPAKVEAESCHSSSHEALATEQANDAHFESDCSCFARTPLPAIASKKGDKRIAVEEQIADIVELPLTRAIEFEVAVASDVPFEPPHSNYQQALLSSLPSRAPPRL
ncbi:MAG: hypothetical protein ABL984_15385 [Pyrinomonadaceae bacterium]